MTVCASYCGRLVSPVRCSQSIPLPGLLHGTAGGEMTALVTARAGFCALWTRSGRHSRGEGESGDDETVTSSSTAIGSWRRADHFSSSAPTAHLFAPQSMLVCCSCITLEAGTYIAVEAAAVLHLTCSPAVPAAPIARLHDSGAPVVVSNRHTRLPSPPCRRS